jgi:uncharacterized protein YutE (UPF0331/DUF86 family)
MTNIKIVENKISSVRKYITYCQAYLKYSQEEIEKDVNIRGMVERYLYLAVQSAIDLADAYASYRTFRKPTTMSEVFEILEENSVIAPELRQKMVKMTGFRNVIAHDYEKINYAIVYSVLHDGLEDIEKLLEKLS